MQSNPCGLHHPVQTEPLYFPLNSLLQRMVPCGHSGQLVVTIRRSRLFSETPMSFAIAPAVCSTVYPEWTRAMGSLASSAHKYPAMDKTAMATPDTTRVAAVLGLLARGRSCC